ncbi:hypothetical protein [Tautonia sociabilis]|uniref:Uncharacterized protein n=1 Tax=Tautonia sociabilis TaxID=2080755 RepID=A0A432MD57_9BACT|nr:hypothetical protein [Tautonia sociabilis]RUL81325.1 hypothetical protein TsocGM_25230 [Tautonia sociabilis]
MFGHLTILWLALLLPPVAGGEVQVSPAVEEPSAFACLSSPVDPAARIALERPSLPAGTRQSGSSPAEPLAVTETENEEETGKSAPEGLIHPQALRFPLSGGIRFSASSMSEALGLSRRPSARLRC